MPFHFYDVESLDNVFTNAIFKEDENVVEVFILVDDPALVDGWSHGEHADRFALDVAERIYRKNVNFRGQVRLYDLARQDHCDYMASQFGVSTAGFTGGPYVNSPRATDAFNDRFRLVCDTDESYDADVHPFLCGYNSYAYDLTILARFFDEAYTIQLTEDIRHKKHYDSYTFKAPSAKVMREHNDRMFNPTFKSNMPSYLLYDVDDLICDRYGHMNLSGVSKNWNSCVNIIRKNMLMTGRHIDVARLNEKQIRVALKRLCGMEGLQILESDKLDDNSSHINTRDELIDLIAYNVSDIVNTAELFNHPFYQGSFALKKGLLETYPELIYDRENKSTYSPVISPDKVRKDRLTIDSTSAQFSTKALCPYDHLYDLPAVSFMYPSVAKAEELGIARRNILDECRDFFYENFPQPEIRAQFDAVYDYYKSIEGKNFNPCSDNYPDTDEYGNPIEPLPVMDVKEIPQVPNCMPYFNADGTPSSCFVTFSVGGIHGMEYNEALYKAEVAEYERMDALFKEVKAMFPNPMDCRLAKTFTLSDGQEHSYTEFLRSGVSIKAGRAAYKDYEKKKPMLFKPMPKGNTALDKKYAYTSADPSNHEDFTSYYPNLLIMMGAFVNEGLGYDRYEEIFGQKESLGKLMKDESIPKDKREFYKVQREGTKLTLNSASGAADATFDSPIRMNNRIISMRIIGQLFSWRIGQAQTIKGAKIISTNTDGLYSVMEQAENDRILAQEASMIGVAIEPEPMFLISKDSNNRLELDAETGRILGANGSALSCWKGPTPTQSLAHAAIIDWALAHYMAEQFGPGSTNTFDDPFDFEVGRAILDSAVDEFEPAKYLLMFQTVIASSPSKYTFNFYTIGDGEPQNMQHYNRVFFVKPETKGAVNLHAAVARKVTPAQMKKRAADDLPRTIIDPAAKTILEANGVERDIIFHPERDVAVKKITGIDESWSCLIENHSLKYMEPERQRELMESLNMDDYLELLANAYNENWRNASACEETPGGEDGDAGEEDAA